MAHRSRFRPIGIVASGIGILFVVTGVHTTYLNRSLVHGQWLIDQKRFPDAIDLLTKAIDATCTNGPFYLSRAIAYYLNGDPEKALVDVDKAAELYPNAVDVKMVRAHVLYALGRADEAMAICERWVRSAPQSTTRALAHANRAYLWVREGQHDKALEDYNRAIQQIDQLSGASWGIFSPWREVSAVFYVNRSRLRRYRGDLEGALGDARVAMRRDNQMGIAFLEAIVIRRLLGRDNLSDGFHVWQYERLSGADETSIQAALVRAKAGEYEDPLAPEIHHTDRRHYSSSTAILSIDLVLVQVSMVLGLLVYFWCVRSGRDGLLFPFYQRGDAQRLGFAPFGAVLRRLRAFRLRTYYIYTFPIFSTLYLLILLTLSHVFIPFRSDTPHAVFFIGAWAFSLLPGSPRHLYVVVAIGFGAGFLFGQTALAGYVGIAIPLGIMFAAIHESNEVFEVARLRRALRSRRSLWNDPLSKAGIIWKGLQLFWLKATPWMMLITLILIGTQSEWTGEQIVLRYKPAALADNPYFLVPLLFVLLNVSVRAFGGVFGYVQCDFLSSIGARVGFQRAAPDRFASSEEHGDPKSSVGADSTVAGEFCINSHDRLLPLMHISPKRFNLAMMFLTLDALLTISSVYQTSFIPGVNPAQIATLSCALKIPFYILAIIWGFMRALPSGHASAEMPNTQYMQQVYRDLDSLLEQVQTRHGERSRSYIDVSKNRYLPWMGGVPEADLKPSD